LLEWLERRFKSAYLRLLESEVERLREENRQLVNSMLVSHGMPGIESPRLPQDMRPVRRATWADYKRRKEKEAALPTIITPGGAAKPVNVAPAAKKPEPDAS
jgi:hypothetical protein